jgi:hypothetical protein
VPVKAVNAKGHRGSGGIVPLILSLGCRWGEWSASCASGFTPGQRQPVTIELDRVGLNAFEKKSISYPYRESKRDSSDGVDSMKETKSLSISKNLTQIFGRLNDRLVIS